MVKEIKEENKIFFGHGQSIWIDISPYIKRNQKGGENVTSLPGCQKIKCWYEQFHNQAD